MFPIIWLLRVFSELLLLLEELYHVYTEIVAATARKTTFDDTMSQMLKYISLETRSRVYLLGAPKAPTVFPVAARHCGREDSCWEIFSWLISELYNFSWTQYKTSTY